VVGASYVACQARLDNIITFDMGGTAAKASIVERGEPTFADSYEVGGCPRAVV
jgi:N-methylhydantoinase A